MLKSRNTAYFKKIAMLNNIRYIVLIFMALLGMYFYYIVFPHPLDRSFFLIYLLLIGIVYWVYKWIQGLIFHNTIQVRISHLVYFFLSHLFILCLCFFAFQWTGFLLWVILFFKILFFLGMIGLFWSTFYALWRSSLCATKFFNIKNESSLTLASLWLGFGMYMMGVFILWYIWHYTLTAVSLWILICCWLSFRCCSQVWESRNIIIKTYDFWGKRDPESKWVLSLLIDELHFWVLTFVLSINFISVYRPFPIGWDDLGAYMNYPKLLSESWELLALWKMYLWELYTGIGFLVWSQTFAFYLNSFSGIILCFVMYVGLKNIFQNDKTVFGVSVKNNETLFDIPLFCTMILMMVPMSVFQLAKDMKLDYGLLALSSIALFLMYELLLWEKHFSHKKSFWPLALIGFIIGVSFSIKVTSLFLLLWILGMLFYKKFALTWLLWFFSLFSGIFTYLGLWKIMNVVIPNDGGIMMPIFSFWLIGLWIFLLIYSYYKKTAGELSWAHVFTEALCIIIGFMIALIPWGIKHISELPEGKQIALWTLISGYPERYNPDYTLLFDTLELQERREASSIGIQTDGTTSNEDFGRYFGYEWGINNYLKLPWNLSFQVNQKGEFTDISYLFFVLIPALFLFLPYKKPEYIYPILAFLGLLLLYYIPNPLWSQINSLFGDISLPAWYIFIFLFVVSPFIYLFYTLKRWSRSIEILLMTLAFSSIYVFLWAISAFGVVWYGIVMYLVFLMFIAVVFHSLEEEWDKETSNKLSYIVLSIVWAYIILSVIPHGVNNLRITSYTDYKLWKQSEETAIFTLHPEYFPILLELNIDNAYQDEMFKKYRNQILEVIDDVPELANYMPAISGSQSLPNLVTLTRSLMNNTGFKGRSEVENIQQLLYEQVIYPPDAIKSTKNIYRVGTFLKYFVSENTQRFFEDSLLVQFENLIYDIDNNVTLERFKKLDISYLLIDLNAATIDNDKEKRLTTRYEHILSFMTHKDLRLIEADSVCLRLGLDIFKSWGDIDAYMQIAGVNYGPYDQKVAKSNACLRELIKWIQSTDTPEYLIGYKNYLEQQGIIITDSNKVAETLARFIQPGSKALFEIR